jgi:hypothetical protein
VAIPLPVSAFGGGNIAAGDRWASWWSTTTNGPNTIVESGPFVAGLQAVIARHRAVGVVELLGGGLGAQ